MLNQGIRFPQLKVIDSQGNDQGVLTTSQALQLAQRQGLDLVVVNFHSQPPIARILDWGKYQYQQAKKKQRDKKAASDIKEIKLSLKIGQHDLETKVKKAQKFLEKFGRIKLTLQLRGRENIYPQKAWEQMEKFRQQVSGHFEGQIKRLGSRFVGLISYEKQNPQINQQTSEKNQTRENSAT